jgi:hydrogenase maturation protein HypF
MAGDGNPAAPCTCGDDRRNQKQFGPVLPLRLGSLDMSPVEGWLIEVHGTVQGVGFRPWVYRLAHEEGLRGVVRNTASGVTIEATGPVAALERFVDRIRSSPPPAASIERLSTERVAASDAEGFHIAPSGPAHERRVSIPPDLATCPECIREIFDACDRRYGYAFTNCTNCGPRFTIAGDVPYDRANTSMKTFEMCSRCAHEYEDPNDRRFHAQPNACPACGPSLQALTPDGTALGGDPVHVAARALAVGRIVAVKGLGGFHLACDATNEAAVRRLRLRKRRDEKPFAVMVGSLEDAARLATLSAAERALLSSVERPIVLVTRRSDSRLASAVAPDNPSVGLLLAYTPLHHLLLAAATSPLVMTSGNFSDEPLAYENREALARLHDVADVFLLHDRDIVSRCDDSVARVAAGQPTVIRRSRGYVPRAVHLACPIEVPVLACGALLKNTFCFAEGDVAYLGPHIGDLENVDTFEAFCEAVERMEHFLSIRPGVIAHDLHPDYMSTHYALGRLEPRKVGVQHHHAHVVSAMAEHGITGPVIGVAYDGTGYGGPSEAAAWGGEVLVADERRFTRLATFRPIALAGGDKAVREPWRQALALLDDAFDGHADLGGIAAFQDMDVDVIRHMIRHHFNAPLAHGVGRYFDAVGALILGCKRASFEGQVALAVTNVADPAERAVYPFDVDQTSELWQVDLRMATREIVADVRDGVAAATIAAKFHNTISAATTFLVRHALRVAGELPIVLTGGCFQNVRLTESIYGELSPKHRVLLHRNVPCGDGGLALGQAVIAGAVAHSAR